MNVLYLNYFADPPCLASDDLIPLMVSDFIDG